MIHIFPKFQSITLNCSILTLIPSLWYTFKFDLSDLIRVFIETTSSAHWGKAGLFKCTCELRQHMCTCELRPHVCKCDLRIGVATWELRQHVSSDLSIKKHIGTNSLI